MMNRHRRALLGTILLLLAGCSCNGVGQSEKSAPHVSSPFSGAVLYNDTLVSELMGIPIETVTKKRGYWDGWNALCWVDETHTPIPAGRRSAEIPGWCNITILSTPLSATARYTMEVTTNINSADPGAGAGYGKEVVSKVSEVRMSEKLSAPKEANGAAPILPGECVTNVFKKAAPKRHMYLVNLPPGKKARFRKSSRSLKMKVGITSGGLDVPIYDHDGSPSPPSRYGEYFNTKSGGTFVFTIAPGDTNHASPYQYGFRVYWGSASGGNCDPIMADVQ